MRAPRAVHDRTARCDSCVLACQVRSEGQVRYECRAEAVRTEGWPRTPAHGWCARYERAGEKVLERRRNP